MSVDNKTQQGDTDSEVDFSDKNCTNLHIKHHQIIISQKTPVYDENRKKLSDFRYTFTSHIKNYVNTIKNTKK